MKNLLLTTAIISSLAIRPAHALFGMGDIVMDIETEIATLNTYLQDVKIWIDDELSGLRQAEQLIHEIQTDLSTAATLYNLTNQPALGAIMSVLGMVGLTNDLPVSPYALMGLMSGYGGLGSVNGFASAASSKFSILSSLVPGAYSTDQLYTCATLDFGCKHSQNRAAANAGQKAALMQIYSTVTSHMKVIEHLRANLQSADMTSADRDHINAQIAIEQAFIANQQAQAQVVKGLAEAQRASSDMQAEQQFHQEKDGMVAFCRAQGACQ